jgi:hypothetical protein
MGKKVNVSKNKSIIELANSLIVDHTEGDFHTAMKSDDGGNHLCVYIDEDFREGYDNKKIGTLINKQFPRLRICNFFVSSGYIKTFLR